MSSKDGRIRKNIVLGSKVQIVQKHDQRTSFLTSGSVEEILTPTLKHPHGIKVRLKSGKIGRVKKILSVKKNINIEEEEFTPVEEPVATKKKKKEKEIILPWERR